MLLLYSQSSLQQMVKQGTNGLSSVLGTSWVAKEGISKDKG